MSHVLDSRSTNIFALPGFDLIDEATLRLLSVPVLLFASLYLIAKALPKSARKPSKGMCMCVVHSPCPFILHFARDFPAPSMPCPNPSVR